MRLAQIVLTSGNVAKTAGFYRETMGMRGLAHGVGYGTKQAHLGFEPGPSLGNDDGAFFWKIGITLRNLDHAVAYLRAEGTEVSKPRQFRDIGYLAHLRDPDGHSIELLQQGGKGDHTDPGNGHPVGGQAILAHLTVRVRDLAAARRWTTARGMRLLSVQDVEPSGFCLYFFAWSTEPLPDADPHAVANRAWLWARPYTLLEVQHLTGQGATPTPSPQLRRVSVEQDGVVCPLDLAGLNK